MKQRKEGGKEGRERGKKEIQVFGIVIFASEAYTEVPLKNTWSFPMLDRES